MNSLKPIMKICTRYVLGVLCFFGSMEALGQRLPFIHYDVDDGLSHERVVAIAQDLDGFMWFGTHNGLCRFDGRTVIPHYPDDKLFRHIRVLCIAQSGQVWLGTSRNGVLWFDGKNFQPFPDQTISHGKQVNAMVQGGDGNLWIGSDAGLFRYGAGGVRHFNEEVGLPAGAVKSLHFDADNHLWVGTDSGLYRQTEAGTFIHMKEMGAGDVGAIASGPDGVFWLGIGSVVYRWSDTELVTIPVNDGSASGKVHCLEVDQWGGVWAGTDAGLFRCIHGELVRVGKDQGGVSRGVLAAFTDREGNLWFGTAADVSMLRNEAFVSWFSSSIRDVIVAEHSEEIWAAGIDSLFRFSDGSLIAEVDPSNFSNATVLCMHEDAAGDLLLGTKGDGIFKYSNGLFSKVVLAPPSKRKMAIICQFASESDGTLWVGTHWCGVARLQDGITTEYTIRDGLPDLRIRDIMLDRKGALWVGTLKGLARIENGKARAFTAEDGMPAREILCLLEDDEGILWIGTDQGVYRYDGERFFPVLPDAFFSKGHCRALAREGDYLYVASAGGLYRVNLEDETILCYTQSDGLSGTSTLPRAITKDANGWLWIGTTKGLTCLKPQLNVPNKQAPPVFITRISRLNEELELHENFEFAADENHIRFDFVGLSYSLPEKVRFRYRLTAGEEIGWTESQESYASYALLPPGHYIFEVMACNNDGVWSADPAAVHFTIVPPFWVTGWFYMLLALLLIAVVSMIYRMREWRMMQHAQELQRLRGYLSNVLDSMPSMLVGVDTAGTIVQWNSEAEQKTGVTKLNAIGTSFSATLPWLGQEDQVRKSIETRTVQTSPTQSRYDRDKTIYEDITVYPLIARGIEGAVIRVDDVTHVVHLQEQFRQAQKMEAVGQLAGGVAHDFNNLLQGILGFSELAAMEADGQVRSYVDEVIMGAKRAKELTQQLLAFSRQQVLEMKDIDLNRTVKDMLKMLHRLIGVHVQLDIQCASEPYTVCADAGQVGQILTNLTVNARDAMPAGGRITIQTAAVSFDEAYCNEHSWARPGAFYLLGVTDNGPGMDQELVSRIFDPFFTTKEVGKGTGLGLAMVYGLVEQHGGFIRVESEVGKGTAFNIYLPQVEGTSLPQEGAAVPFAPERGRETILLAEDNDSVRMLTKKMLQHAGYTVISACHGLEALEILEQSGEQIDLAILDVIMPRAGGREVYEYLQKNVPNIPVLFASGYNEDATHTDFIQEKGLELLQKPWSRSELFQRIQNLLSNRSA